jgi:hypothetical protein
MGRERALSPLNTTASRQQTIQNSTENTVEWHAKTKRKRRCKLPNITEKTIKQTERNRHLEQQHREQQSTTGMKEHPTKERKKKQQDENRICQRVEMSHLMISDNDRRSPARSLRQVPLLRGDILVVSSKLLQIEQRDFGGRFMCV